MLLSVVIRTAEENQEEMMMRRIAVLLALVMIFAACASTTTDETSGSDTGSTEGTAGSTVTEPAGTEPPDAQPMVPTGTLTVAHGVDIASLDPQTVQTSAIMGILTMMVETLTELTPEGTIEPLLATSWDISDDGLVYTFTLREGVSFSDGEPFNAEAVKFSLERLISPDTVSGAPNVLAVIDTVDVIDDLHVAVNLKSAFPPLISALSLTLAAIVSPTSASTAPNSPEQIVEPVGTGPYVLKELAAGDHLTVTANPDYWGTLPSFAEQIFLVVPEASSRIALLRSGGADVAINPSAVELPAMEQDAALSVVVADTAYVTQIVINNVTVDDPTIRRALNYAVDRQQIIDSILFGAGSLLDSPVPNLVEGHCAVDDWYDYDPDLARQLLAEAGASDLSLTMVSPEGRYLQDYAVAEAVAGMFRAVGVTVDLANPLDWPTYLSEVMVPPEEATSDLRLLGWGTLYNEASQSLLQFQSDQWPPNGFNATYSNDPEYDPLVAAANTTIDEAARFDLYCQAQNEITPDAPTVWLYSQAQLIVSTSDVKGVYGLSNLMYITTWAEPAS